MKTFKRMMSIIAGAFVLAMLIAGLTYADNEAVKILDAQGQTVGEYETLAAAYDAVQDGQTLQLQQDIDLGEERFACNAGRSFTLDLNGKTLQGGYYAHSGYRAAVEMSNGGSLTITDSTADKKGAIINPSTSGGNGIKVGDAGTLTLEAGTIRASYTGIQSSYLNSKVIINGGSVMSHCDGQVGSWAGVSAYGDLTVGDGAVITGDRSGIRVSSQRSPSSGTITVNGGKITATGGYAVTNSGTITIMGGVFKGSEACLTSLKAGDGRDPVFNISGGWYSDKVDDSYVVEGYTATDERPESERIDKDAPYTVLKYYDLYVGGVHVNNKNKNDIPIDSGKASYDPKTNTLTLDNATIDVVRRDDADDTAEYGIRANENGPFIVNLIGKNTVKDSSTEEGTTSKYGVYLSGEGKVTFIGEGSLDIKMTSGAGLRNEGIDVQRDVDLDGVDVTIEMSEGGAELLTKGVLISKGKNTLFSVINKSSLRITTDQGFAFDGNAQQAGVHLCVGDDAVFEAVSNGLNAIHYGQDHCVQLTPETRALGALLNADPTQEGASEVATIPENLNNRKYVRIPVTHVWGDWETVTEPTCTTDGEAIHYCKNKDCEANETKALSALGHEWGPWKVTIPATVEKEGEEQRACTRSGCNAKETRKISKLHSGIILVTVADIPAKSMKLTWTKVSGAKSYKVSYRKKGGKWKTKKTPKTKCTIKGMKTAKYYEFKVAPVFKGGKTGEYSEVNCRFYRAVKGTAKGVKNGIKLNWSKEPKASGYTVYCSTSKSFKSYKEVQLKDKNRKSYTFKGLKKGKTYYVIVRSYINKGGKKYLGITYPIRKVKTK